MIKNNKRLIIGFILGAIMFTSIGVCAATLINSKEVTYDNTNSKLEATNTQDAIDELYEKSKLKNRDNIVEAYTYNQTTGATNYCVTGDEDTCVETKCHENTTAGSCPAGTIIVYKVSDTEIVRFHVMYDNGSTMTMQSQRNTVYNTEWIDEDDYTDANTDNTTCGYKSCNDQGPITSLKVLSQATAGWNNVNTIEYTMGTTIFKTNAYTGCSAYNSCTTNVYTLPKKISKTRMITVQEAEKLGCTENSISCPIWMYNYLYDSTSYGGTIDDKNPSENGSANYSYLTMSANSSVIYYSWYITYSGRVNNGSHTYGNTSGARAVVEINK